MWKRWGLAADAEEEAAAQCHVIQFSAFRLLIGSG